jgi:hypothetical protein
MRSVLRILLYLMALALGAGMMAYYWQPELFAHVVEFENEHPREARLVAAGLAMVLLLSPLSIMLRWIQATRRGREISYSTDTGRVSVNLIAIQEALTRALEHEDCVRKAHVHLYEDRVKRQVVIDAAMTFWEVPNVTERNRQCQILLRRRFAELMPEQKVLVNLSVHRITPRREKDRERTDTHEERARQSTRIEEPALPGPFAGTPLAHSVGAEVPVGQYLLPPPGADQGRPALPPAPSEDELYVGPSYPVEDDDESSADNNIIGRALPVRQRPIKDG